MNMITLLIIIDVMLGHSIMALALLGLMAFIMLPRKKDLEILFEIEEEDEDE